MKYMLILLGVAVVFAAGCSKPTPEEYFTRAEEEEAEAVLIADTLTSIEDRREVFSEAVETYTTLMDEYSSSEYSEAALFRLATIYNNHTREFRKAVDAFSMYIRSYPEGEKSAVSVFMIGYIYNNELGMLDSARAAYEQFLSQYPDHEMAMSAKFELENLGRSPEELVPAADDEAEQVARRQD
ncbi:MAG: tetratricopeptide repeat protein [Bacteroidetes bacterium]|nr:tetratricopeptide repeat protein [Bacteroidota bacterium]